MVVIMVVNLSLGNCLFGAVSLTKSNDNVRYKCSGYSLDFYWVFKELFHLVMDFVETA